MRGNNAQGKMALSRALVLAATLAVLWTGSVAALPPGEISPDAVPQVLRINPSQAAAGDEVTLVIQGQNFSPGAYVPFTNPLIHVLATQRVSGMQLEAKLAINKMAQPGNVSLYVSNPASSVAEGAFTIAQAGAPQPASSVTTEDHPSQSGTPEVTSVDPPRVAPGSEASLKITGKNFAQGAKVSFANPGIQVQETTPADTTVLTVRIRVVADAPAGKTSLFVVNPDDSEAEAPFEVASSSPAAAPKGATTSKPAADSATQRFDVYNLGDVATILQTRSKTKGTLVVAGKKLTYEESGKEVFSTALADIKEVEANAFFGINTGTFHIILKSGQSYNFVASSLRPADSQSVVDSLQKAIR